MSRLTFNPAYIDETRFSIPVCLCGLFSPTNPAATERSDLGFALLFSATTNQRLPTTVLQSWSPPCK